MKFSPQLKIITLLILPIFISMGYAERRWDLNDVSVLMSLPNRSDPQNFLLSPQSQGPKGELLGVEHKEFIGDLILPLQRSLDEKFNSLMVVGMRIDPCFESDAKNPSCRYFVKLIWQPVDAINSRSWDAAVHTFYEVNKKEFQQFLSALQAIKNKNLAHGITTHSRPLYIHPALLNLGRRKSANDEFKEAILSITGKKNLKRITVMRLISKDLWWQFAAAEINHQGQWESMEIPRLSGASTQDFFNEENLQKMGMRGASVPVVKSKLDNISLFIHGPQIKNNEEDRNELKSALVAINRIENPRIHSAKTLDCAHCHVSDAVKLWTKNSAPSLVEKYSSNLGEYILSFRENYNLTNRTLNLGHNKSLRAFGHFNGEASISQRTINESAEVAIRLNKQRW
jgi:hypothetical protein